MTKPAKRAGVLDIGKFGSVGGSNDLATFRAAAAYANSVGGNITFLMRRNHTIIDNSADANSISITANNVYFLAPPSGTTLTLCSSAAGAKNLFAWNGGSLSILYTFAAATAENGKTLTLGYTSGLAAGDLFYVIQAYQFGTSLTHSCIRQIKSINGNTITLHGGMPWGFAMADTMQAYKITPQVGGGFLGKVRLDCAGMTGDNLVAMFGAYNMGAKFEDIEIHDCRGGNLSGETRGFWISAGFNNCVDRVAAYNSGSVGGADITIDKQDFGTFGEILSYTPVGFGPGIGYGSCSNFGTVQCIGGQSTRSVKIQGNVKSKFDKVVAIGGADTGVYIVMGSDGTQIAQCSAEGNAGLGCTISASNNVEIGTLRSKDNTQSDLFTDTTHGSAGNTIIGVALLGTLSTVTASGRLTVAKLIAMDTGAVTSINNGVIQ